MPVGDHRAASIGGVTLGAVGGEARGLRVTRSLVIPLEEIGVRATTSGGPGGQHANRTRSRVDVTFDVMASAALGPRQRTRILERLGEVVRATAADERSQSRNRDLALGRLAAKLATALREERPRRATRPTAASVARRVESKRRLGVRKVDRRRPSPGDDG
jgi:ribosome-associated protein